jgi:hypothetical protein
MLAYKSHVDTQGEVVRRLFFSILYPAFFQNITRLIQESKGNERVCRICPTLEATYFVAKECTHLRT